MQVSSHINFYFLRFNFVSKDHALLAQQRRSMLDGNLKQGDKPD